MYNIFIKSLKTGVVTTRYPEVKTPAPARFRGKPQPDYSRCTGCGSCAAACPGQAILLNEQTGARPRLEFRLDSCIFCGVCQQVCPSQAITLGGRFELAVKDRSALKLEGEIG